MHELMHVLGFAHEHQRHDQWKYINIFYDNIQPGEFRSLDNSLDKICFI